MNIAICAMVKDEPDLREWMAWHFLIGVDRVFLYDNGSHQRVVVNNPNVIMHGWAGKGEQCRIYNHALTTYGQRFNWMAFIDADEFIYPVSEPLKDILADYNHVGGLAVHWALFGSSGHLTRQPSVIDAYTHRAPFSDNASRLVKTICQPHAVRKFDSTHWARYQPNYFAVDENQYRVPMGKEAFTGSRIRLNHYFCRSREDMQQKCVRGWGFANQKRTMPEMEKFDARCTVEDTGMKDLRRKLCSP